MWSVGIKKRKIASCRLEVHIFLPQSEITLLKKSIKILKLLAVIQLIDTWL